MPSGIYLRTEKHIKESISHLPKKSLYWKGKKFSEAHKEKLSKNHKGMSGKHHTIESRIKIARGHYGKIKPTICNERHPLWKGNHVGYGGLHKWVARKLGTPKECEKCGTLQAKRYEWANRSHRYLRELNDWIRLCKSCHEKFDKTYAYGQK